MHPLPNPLPEYRERDFARAPWVTLILALIAATAICMPGAARARQQRKSAALFDDLVREL